MQGIGLWVSPQNKIIKVQSTHIRAVLDAPEVYGMTQESLHAVFKKYNEKIGHEGKARKEIIFQLLYHGWIQIRNWGEDRMGGWRFNYWAVDTPMSRIRKVVSNMIDQGLADYRDSISLAGWAGTPESPTMTFEREYLDETTEGGEGGVLRFLDSSRSRDLSEGLSKITSASKNYRRVEEIAASSVPDVRILYSVQDLFSDAFVFFTSDGYRRRVHLGSDKAPVLSDRIEGLAEACLADDLQTASYLISRSLL